MSGLSSGVAPDRLPAGHGCSVALGLGQRAASYVFVGFFALCLILPFAQTLYPIFGTIVPPLEERRSPSAFPALGLLLNPTGDFASELNSWFDDRAGFRNLFVRAKNQIDYTAFHTSGKVYVGSDGWLFEKNQTPIERMDEAAVSRLKEWYLTLARRLQQRNVKLIVVGYPNKAAIYPEMGPARMPRRVAGGNYDQIRRFLASRSEFVFIDAENIFEREKSETSEQLYMKGDLHATQIAQAPVVKEIIARIAQLEGRADIQWNENFTVMHEEGGGHGSEARFLSLLFPTTENYPIFRGYYLVGHDEPDGDWDMPDRRALFTADDGIGRPFDWQFRAHPQLCQQRLPATVVFGNSFSDFWWDVGFHRYFCSVRRGRNPISRLKAFVEAMPPDTKYFIFQYYETWIEEVLTDTWLLPATASLK